MDHIPQPHYHPLSSSTRLYFVGNSCTAGAKLSTTLQVLVSQGRGSNHFPQPAHWPTLPGFHSSQLPPGPFLQSWFLSSLSVHNLVTKMLWEILAPSLRGFSFSMTKITYKSTKRASLAIQLNFFWLCLTRKTSNQRACPKTSIWHHEVLPMD